MLLSAADTIEALTASAGRDPAREVVGVAGPDSVPQARLAADLANGAYGRVTTRRFRSDTAWAAVPQFVETTLGPLAYHYDGEREAGLYATGRNVVVSVDWSWYSDQFTVSIGGTTQGHVDRLMAGFASLLPTPPPPPPPPPLPDNVIPVAFWMQDPTTREAYSRRRDITVHEWSEVQANYPQAVRDEADPLVTMGAPTSEGSGKLVLLHGPPGTGKTRFILTLLSEWRHWGTASVVTDSDRFFGDATYLNSIVFGVAGIGDWLVLVVEDGDDYLNVDARSTKGQSIARLLNIADGIVGQGINLLTIMTTNVPMDQLNPAIVRPGRALANIHFAPFGPDEASAWCAERGRTVKFDKDEVTLAEMYASLRQ